MDKEKLLNEIKILEKRRKLFLILALTFLGISVILYILSVTFEVMFNANQNNYLYFTLAITFSVVSSVLLSGSIALLVIRTAVFGTKINNRKMALMGFDPNNFNNQFQNTYKDSYIKKDNGETVDVKPVEDNPYADLLKQYEELYKKGLISEEDFNKKKEELK